MMMLSAQRSVPLAVAHRPGHRRLEAVEEIVERVGLQRVVVGEHEHVYDDARVADALHKRRHLRPDCDVAAAEVLPCRELQVHAWHTDYEEAYEERYEKCSAAVLIAYCRKSFVFVLVVQSF